MDRLWAHLTPEQLAALGNVPITAPPEGITSNFVNPPTIAPLATWTTSILVTVALFFYLNRMYIKARLLKKFTWDDLTLSIAMAMGCTEYALHLWACQIGILGLHLWDIPVARMLSLKVQHFFYIIFVIQPGVLLLLKSTFFILYLNIFYNLRWARISSWIGLVFTIVANFAIGIMTFVVARPDDSTSYQKYTPAIGISLGTIGLAIDLAIFVIPYIVVAGLQLSRTRRIGAYVMFLTGACAIICSIVNIYYRYKLEHSTDPVWDEIRPAVAALAEIFLGISCACIPSLAYGIRHTGSIYQKVLRITTLDGSSRMPSSTPTSSNRFQKKDIELGSMTSTSQIHMTVTVEMEVETNDFRAK